MPLNSRKMLPVYSDATRIMATHKEPSAHPEGEPLTLALPRAMKQAAAAYERGDWVGAERLCRTVLKADADHFDALHLCGMVTARTGRTQESADLLLKAVSVNPNNANAHYHRGIALGDLQRYAEALESYDHALALKPDHVRACNNRGYALAELHRHAEALESYQRALALKPDYAEAYNNRGVALAALHRYAEALESYQLALALKSDYAEAYNNRGAALSALERHGEALESWERALQLKPDYEFLYGRWLNTKMKVCDWNDIAGDSVRLGEKIARGEKATQPFPVLAMPLSPAIQRRAAEIWVDHKHAVPRLLPAIPRRPRRDKIRIGYFSANLHEHAVARLLAGVFERHDRSRFHVSAFSFGPDTNDAMRRRLSVAFDEFIDVRAQSDRDVAMLARNRGIDIAVDLMGFTQDARTTIFAFGAAPIQVNFLGYPGTMGAAFIDYLVADATLVPETSRPHYSEAIAYLPNSFQPNDTRREIADKVFSREELGLPHSCFVFCCFHNSYKITPDTFDSWTRILRHVDGGVLWLPEDNALATDNLRKEAERRGVRADRLVFAPYMPATTEHMARYRMADLFLDALPYNAHTTASDALWAGLPVLTCLGETFAGRVAASLLIAVGLPELITRTAEEYEGVAIDLATDADKLGRIREDLAGQRQAAPLFDTTLFARNIEAAYTAMYERYLANLAPAHIHVQG